MRFEAPGFALIGSTFALSTCAIGNDGVPDGDGVIDEGACGTGSAQDTDHSLPIAHSIAAVARTRRLKDRFI